jgi:hypothetical protein
MYWWIPVILQGVSMAEARNREARAKMYPDFHRREFDPDRYTVPKRQSPLGSLGGLFSGLRGNKTGILTRPDYSTGSMNPWGDTGYLTSGW